MVQVSSVLHESFSLTKFVLNWNYSKGREEEPQSEQHSRSDRKENDLRCTMYYVRRTMCYVLMADGVLCIFRKGNTTQSIMRMNRKQEIEAGRKTRDH